MDLESWQRYILVKAMCSCAIAENTIVESILKLTPASHGTIIGAMNDMHNAARNVIRLCEQAIRDNKWPTE